MKHHEAWTNLGQGHGGWFKSSRSKGANNCVEIKMITGHVGVRDSKLGAASPIFVASSESWETFLRHLEDGI